MRIKLTELGYTIILSILIFILMVIFSSCGRNSTPQSETKYITQTDTLFQFQSQIDTFYIASEFDTCFAEKQTYNWLVKEYQYVLSIANELQAKNTLLGNQLAEKNNALNKLKKAKNSTIIINNGDSNKVEDVKTKTKEVAKNGSAVGEGNSASQTKEIGFWKIFIAGIITGIVLTFLIKNFLMPKVTAFSNSIWKFVK